MKMFVNARFLSQPVSGVQRYAIECSRKIKKIWPETRFLAPRNIWNEEVFAELGAEITGKNTGHMWEQVDLPRFAINNGKLPLFNPCNSAPLLYKNNYTTIHDLAFFHHPEWNSKKFSTWYNFLIPRIAGRSRHVFTVSKTIAEELAHYYHLRPEKISVTYNGISAAIAGNGANRSQYKKPLILAVGTLNMRKNQAQLVKAFLKSNTRSSHRLVLVGDKNQVFRSSDIENMIAPGIPVEVVSGITEQELSMLYREAEVVASTSLYEGFGIPLLEGLASGCKLLCSDIPVYRELYADVATFCDPTNPDNIAAALQSVVNGPLPPHELVTRLMQTYSYQHAAEVITSAVSRTI